VRHGDFEISGSDNATSSLPFRVCTLGHTHSSETVIQRLQYQEVTVVVFATLLCKYERIFDDSHLGTFTSDEFLPFSLSCCLYLFLRVVCKFVFRRMFIILLVAVVLQLS
jgi:hypothetical protein